MNAIRTLCLLLATSCLLALSACTANDHSPANTPEPHTDTSQQAIGTYDSRSIAVAYAGSAKHEQLFQSKMKQLKQAEATGDAKQIAKAKQVFTDMQNQMHQQAFGTASVQNILEQYPQQLNELKAKYHVEAIISKWDKDALSKYKNTKQIDLTTPMIDMIEPTQKQRKSAIEIQKHKPLSKQQAENIPTTE